MKQVILGLGIAFAMIVVIGMVAVAFFFSKSIFNPSPAYQQNSPPPQRMFVDNQKVRESQSIVAVWKQIQTANESAKYLDGEGAEKFSWLKYANEIAVIDCTACPQDFQDAIATYDHAVTSLASHLNALTAIAGAMDALHGRATELTQINGEKADVESSLIECKRVASQHGVTFTEN